MEGVFRFPASGDTLVLTPERQGQNLALTVSYMPYSLDSGRTKAKGSKAVDAPQVHLIPFHFALQIYAELRAEIRLTTTATVGI